MGFDISYHPISPQQMEEWYFSPLREMKKKTLPFLKKKPSTYDLEPFYAEKYLETLNVAANTPPQDPFDTTHAYFLAVVQGFFHTFYYTRGTAFSFLLEEQPEFVRYTQPWQEICKDSFPNPISNRIIENYCGGVYLPYVQVKQLYEDYTNNREIKEILTNFYQENLPVFLKAINHCLQEQVGLLEAAEVIEPNPISLNDSGCYSNLFNCDTDGAFIYQQTALGQIQAFAQQQGVSVEEVLNNVTYNRVINNPSED